jgi:hypothetical protein
VARSQASPESASATFGTTILISKRGSARGVGQADGFVGSIAERMLLRATGRQWLERLARPAPLGEHPGDVGPLDRRPLPVSTRFGPGRGLLEQRGGFVIAPRLDPEIAHRVEGQPDEAGVPRLPEETQRLPERPPRLLGALQLRQDYPHLQRGGSFSPDVAEPIEGLRVHTSTISGVPRTGCVSLNHSPLIAGRQEVGRSARRVRAGEFQ